MTNSSPPMRATTSWGRTQSFRDFGDAQQKAIAKFVAETVIDDLEAIEVDKEQGHRLELIFLAAVESDAQFVQQELAIGEAGQDVVGCGILQSCFRHLALLDIGTGAEPADKTAIRAQQRQSVDLKPTIVAAGIANAAFHTEFLKVAGGACPFGGAVLQLLGTEHFDEGLAAQVFLFGGEKLEHAVIAVFDRAVRQSGPDVVRNRFGEEAEVALVGFDHGLRKTGVGLVEGKAQAVECQSKDAGGESPDRAPAEHSHPHTEDEDGDDADIAGMNERGKRDLQYLVVGFHPMVNIGSRRAGD